MTSNQSKFLHEFQGMLIQPILDKLDADQQRKHPMVHSPDSQELADLIRSLKIESKSKVSFQVQFTCKGDMVCAYIKKNRYSKNLEHVLWELSLILEMAELKHISFPAHRELSRLKQGIHDIMQIFFPEKYGMFDYKHRSAFSSH